MAIDYKKPHKFNRNMSEKLEFLLWATCTPSKSSAEITPKFNALSVEHNLNKLVTKPIQDIVSALKQFKIGQYTRISRAWDIIGKCEISPTKSYAKSKNCKIDFSKPVKIMSDKFLTHCHRDHLKMIDGIGIKTASFYCLSNNKWAEVAALDTHILKYLQQKFPKYPVPKNTPTSMKEYKPLETMFIGCAVEQNMTAAELDLEIWKKYSDNN